MCGRFTQRFSWGEVHSFLRLGSPGPALNLRPRYNLAPSQNAAVVRDEDGERRLSMLRWGLVAGWAKDPNIGHKLINARAETAAVKPSYRAAYSRRRCLVPADGFYEWRREGELRQPWLIAPRDGGIVAFAGLWERWSVPEGAVLRGSLSERRAGDVVETFTILTTEANTTMRALHHRMPVILAHEAGEQWLAGDNVVLGPAPDDLLGMHRVPAMQSTIGAFDRTPFAGLSRSRPKSSRSSSPPRRPLSPPASKIGQPRSVSSREGFTRPCERNRSTASNPSLRPSSKPKALPCARVRGLGSTLGWSLPCGKQLHCVGWWSSGTSRSRRDAEADSVSDPWDSSTGTERSSSRRATGARTRGCGASRT